MFVAARYKYAPPPSITAAILLIVMEPRNAACRKVLWQTD
jgi:hypothetical protein